MSDYLTRLAERTLGRAVTIRPTLAPLFGDNAAVSLEEPSTAGDAGSLTPARNVEGGRAVDAPAAPAAASVAPRHDAAPGDPREARPAALVPSRRDAEPAHRLRPTEVAPVEASALRQANRGAVADATAQPQRPTQSAPAVRPRGRRAPAVDALVRAAAARSSSEVPRPLLPPNSRTEERAVVPVVTPRATSSRRAAATGGAEAEVPPPSIRISIGRIDVRATPPARRSREERARGTEPDSARLSLRDYLAGRAGDGAPS